MRMTRSYGPDADAALAAAFSAAYEAVDDPCCDNERVADMDSPDEVAAYEAAAAEGCCGSYEGTVTVGGRTFRFGFNYGH